VAVRALLSPIIVAAVVATAAATACSKPPADPLQLERGTLTVSNRSAKDWTHVEIWLNRSYRVTVATIPAGTTFQVPLDAFVAGFGQRFDVKRTQVQDLRLTATLADGQPFELKKAFTASGLAGALGGPH
jgi:hypothetical protein